ncbi:MAG: hypothetical protein QXL38_01845 [Candidatus Bathyarchaeia archaeon]
MKKKKLLPLTLIVLVATALALTQKAECVAEIKIYGYTDKPQYMPGETVTLKLWVYNKGPDKIVLENVTIYCPWATPVWGGDVTEANINKPLPAGESWNKNFTFTIPSDSKVFLKNCFAVKVTYTIGSNVYEFKDDYAVPLKIVIPLYQSLENMDKLLALITLQVVLMIVCTIILAATMFLSTRRPKVVIGED